MCFQGVRTLCQHGFDGNSLHTGRLALRCLANVMLLKPETRQIFVDLGYAPKAAECLKVRGLPAKESSRV